MNPIAIMNMAMLYFKLNSGQSSQAKAILKEGVDVIETLSKAMKDNKITKEVDEIRIGVIGSVDSGKSTITGVITKNILDNGRGFARSMVV